MLRGREPRNTRKDRNNTMSKRTKAHAPEPVKPIEPPAPVAKKKRRRRRRRSAAILAARTITDIKAKERQFLRDVSALLTDALGFPVRVSHVKVRQELTPAMRKAQRMTRAQSHRQIADSMFEPV